MLQYNHYLKELGIEKTDYPFNEQNITEDIGEFASVEFYSLDYTLACSIYSYLCYYRDHCMIGYPTYMSVDKWSDIVNKMITGFKIYIQRDGKLSKTKQKQMHYGMRLFIKYFGELWY
jgi:hypothetical protein